MSGQRLSLIHYDVMRELCDHCRKERFHFVPIGAPATTGTCKNCGSESKLADVSDTSIWRLMTRPNGEMVVVPLVSN
jgi:hypothetical protein